MRGSSIEAIEEAPPVTKETPVIVQDTEKVDSLTAEVERLKASLLSQTQAAEEAKQACAAAQAQNEELTTKLGDAEKKVDQLEGSVQRGFAHLHKVLGSHFLMVGCLVDWMT